MVALRHCRVFPVLWKIARVFVDPKTRSKCVILKGDEGSKLLEYFNAEDLPVEYGGSCSCVNGCLPPIPNHMVSFTHFNICVYQGIVPLRPLTRTHFVKHLNFDAI